MFSYAYLASCTIRVQDTMTINNMKGLPLVYGLMRMSRVSGIEPKHSEKIAVLFSLLQCFNIKLIYANIDNIVVPLLYMYVSF